MTGSAQRLEVTKLTKAFGGIRALTDVSLSVAPASIHALLGENGAGKSTLVKIVIGMYGADSGSVSVDGMNVTYASPMKARSDGVVAVYQDPRLFPHLDIAENIFMGVHPRGRLGLISRSRMYDEAQRLLDTLEANLDPRRPVMGLSIGEAQLVEFARAMAVGRMRLLFLDEPTAALTPAETERLFDLVQRLRSQGTSIVFISHRLEEIEGLVDEVTVLRDGRHVQTTPAQGLSQRQIVNAMVGRELDMPHAPKTRIASGKPRLTVKGLEAPGYFSDVSFDVQAGEVVGMAGLVGAGRSEIAHAIMGLHGITAGTISIDGRVIDRPSPRLMKRAGVAYLPEDRDTVGLVSSHSIKSNLTLASLEQVSTAGILRNHAETTFARELVSRLQIKAGSIENAVATLSGGNRQKVAIGKWLARSPAVFVLDEPTHGIDVGTKAHIHRMIAELAAAGAAVLVISSDLPEIVAISDRILVIRHGRIVASLSRSETSQELVMAYATGQEEAA